MTRTSPLSLPLKNFGLPDQPFETCFELETLSQCTYLYSTALLQLFVVEGQPQKCLLSCDIVVQETLLKSITALQDSPQAVQVLVTFEERAAEKLVSERRQTSS